MQSNEINSFQSWTFSWLDPLFKRGSVSTLQFQDLPPVPKSAEIDFYQEKILNRWVSELDKNPKTANLRNVLWKEFQNKILLDGSLRLLSDLLLATTPIFLVMLVNFINDTKTAIITNRPDLVPPITAGIAYCFGLLLIMFTSSFLLNQQIQRSTAFALNLRFALISIIYKKSMRLSYASRSKFDSGTIASIVSTDCSRIETFFININWIWVSPITVLVTIGILIYVLGWPALVGFFLLCLVYPVQSLIMASLRLVRKHVAPITDSRVKNMQELIMGIRIVKMFAWEIPYMNIIINIRNLELAQVLKKGFLQAYIMVVGFSFPIFAGIFTILVYVTWTNNLDSAILFASLGWFNQLRSPLFWVPATFAFKADSDVGLDRISALLRASEIQNHHQLTQLDDSLAIKLENVDFQWESFQEPIPSNKTLKVAVLDGKSTVDQDTRLEDTDQKPIPQLSNLNLEIFRGQLVGIIGQVGSGKSTFLSGLIGEATTTSGSLQIQGRLGFASQQPWIQNASIKENILFGRPYDEELYLAVLRDAALERDLEILQDGDQTDIGERGINLSGGQKQRVSLARLMYSQPDVALMDDPLSAVDSQVGHYLFENCINGGLAGKTRILVTHQLELLSKLDKILVLKNKTIVQQGTFSELLEMGGEFEDVVKQMKLKTNQVESAKPSPDDSRTIQQNRTNSAERIKTIIEAKEKKPTRKMMQDEDMAQGTVEFRIWLNYLISSGSWLAGAILSCFLFQVVRIFNDYWLLFWIEENFKLPRERYMLYYVLIAILQSSSVYILSLFFAKASVSGAKRLHEKALERVMKAPLHFFDTTPVGRIMNRFTKDLDGMDNAILDSLRRFIINFTNALAIFVVILIATPIFAVPLLFILAFYYHVQNHYRKTSRELKRIDSVSRSPLYAHIGESLAGLSTIRAYGKDQRFITQNNELLNNNQRPYYLLMSATQWLSLRLELASGLVVFFAAVFGCISRESSYYSANMMGLTLGYSFQVTQVINFCIKLFIESEIAMNQVERIDYFGTCLAQEKELHNNDIDLPNEWPQNGSIQIENLSARYSPDLPKVLKNVSLSINPGEKIGICGRTGSGKSTIIQCIFRTIEPDTGSSIVIDGIDILQLGLNDLRSKLGIIPQDPVLFSGTIRRNLDPFDQYDDQTLWDCLEKAAMKDKILEMGQQGLESIVQPYGENFSIGQRQLLCLARALVRKPKILICDEMSASVDYKTDEKIQLYLRQELKGCTLLTIAHRLSTIMDYDKILVLDDGSIVQFGPPQQLLLDTDGQFFKMVHSSSD